MAKIRFTITGEYEAHPENYAGETDIHAMIAIDEETLLIVDAIELDDNMTLTLEPAADCAFVKVYKLEPNRSS